jgi:DNA-binding FadR family transcriptional regulator
LSVQRQFGANHEPQINLIRRRELLVRTHGVRLESLLECRIAVEPMLARLAGAKRTDEQLEEIAELHRRFVASIDDVALGLFINREGHLAIARASGNEPLTALIEAISTPFREAQSNGYAAASDLRAVTRDHTAILEAIAAKDGDAAFDHMERDVIAFRGVATKAEVIGSFSKD